MRRGGNRVPPSSGAGREEAAMEGAAPSAPETKRLHHHAACLSFKDLKTLQSALTNRDRVTIEIQQGRP